MKQKKSLALLLLLLFALVLGACSKGDNKESTTKELEGSLEEIFEKIYAGVDIELPRIENVEITKENSEYYLGIPNMEFEEALASESMITSVAYSTCLVRLPEGSDVEAIKKEIAKKVNPAKWICVGVDPENVLVDNIGNVVFLVMTNDGASELMDSFLALGK